jgi:hypothetical protein
MFKDIRDDRPYPPSGLTSATWHDVKTKYVPISELVATQGHLHIAALHPEHRTSHSGDRLAHVVKFGGVFYLEDGHHRVVREALAGSTHVNVRLLDMDREVPEPPPALSEANEPEDTLAVPGLVWVEGKGYRSVHLARALQSSGRTVDWHRWSPGTSDLEARQARAYKDVS